MDNLTENEVILEHISTLRILCVEDDISTHLIYEAIFSSSVKNLIFAHDGQEGYDIYSKNKIDIIISRYGDIEKQNLF